MGQGLIIYLLRGNMSKKSTVFEDLTPRSRTYELRGQGKKKGNDQNQDKQTPHTVLQKLSLKTTHVPFITVVSMRHEQYLGNHFFKPNRNY